MESTSPLFFLSQIEDRLGEPLREGQREVIERFSVATSVVAQLPTGLGKTRTAVSSYAVLRKQNLVNRVLYIVPRGVQANQAADEFPRDLGIILDTDVSSLVIGDTPIPAIKAHRSGSCEIFITTIQALVANGNALTALREMIVTGKWFVVVDEYHHYGDAEKPWTKKLKSLPRQALLAMSATPYRLDQSEPFGKPEIAMTYRRARELGYVKALELHAYDYRVDAVVNNVDVQTFTTSEIYKLAGSTNPDVIDREMAVRELRWSPRYVSPLLEKPIARLMSYPFEAQMLVQAISCSHARMVCEQIKSLVSPGTDVDWVGTGPRGRPDAENDAVLKRFCPKKDNHGIRQWTLDILVNVGMAGEGLDPPDVFEIVFLNAPGLNNTTLQAIGRLSRIPRDISPVPKGIVSVDEACEMAAYAGDSVETCFEEEPEINKGKPREPSDYDGDYPIPADVIIKNAELIDIRNHPHYETVMQEAMSRPYSEHMVKNDIEKIVEDTLREGLKRRDAIFNASAEIIRQRKRIENACRLKAFQALGKIKKAGRLQVIEYQDVIKKIKGRKNRELRSNPDDCSLEELKRHIEWLERLQLELKDGLPPWL